MIRRATAYVLLISFAIVALLPFVYLMTSSIKPRSVFFSAPFLPTTPLFVIDPATGSLAIGDDTLLPPVEDSAVFELDVVLRLGQQQIGQRRVRLAWGEAAALEQVDFVIPSTATTSTRIGSVKIAPDDYTQPLPAGAVATYAIQGGNRAGFGHIAWGQLTLGNFERLFRGTPRPDPDPISDSPERIPTGVWRAILNSFFFASITAVLATLGAAMGGYGLAKFRFPGRSLIDNTVLAALVIPGALLIAPGYQLLYWLGLLDTYLGLILPGLAPAFGVYLFRQAMISSLPTAMMEAARIDGCGELRLFFTIALPMVRPMAGAFLLITYLGAWNNFIGPQIVLQSPEKLPLAVWISQLRGVYGIDYGLIMAATLVSITPVLVLFLLLQRDFIAGLTAGAVKG
ncbi:MAG: carbohydrate ABC transporter permease [Planctomycetota bacterium]